MSIESPADVAGMVAAGRAVAETLRELREAAVPGVTTAWLDSVAAAALRRRGARPVPAALLGFPGGCCLSVNDEAVHGVPGPRRLRPSDVLKLDVTAEVATMWESPSVPNFEDRGREVLTEGLVLAVEPIIAARRDRVVEAPDGWTLRTRDGSLTAHVEHTIVVRGGRPLIVTAPPGPVWAS